MTTIVSTPQYDLHHFYVLDLISCAKVLRQTTANAHSMEEAATQMLTILYDHFRDSSTGTRQLTSVEFVVTHHTQNSSPLGGDTTTPRNASDAERPATDDLTHWTVPASGSAQHAHAYNHRVVPISGAETADDDPIVRQLLAHYGILPSAEFDNPSTPEHRPYFCTHQDPIDDSEWCDIGHMQEADQSTFAGFGDQSPSGRVIGLIIHSTTGIPRTTIEMFRSLFLRIKMILLRFDSFDGQRLFVRSPTATTTAADHQRDTPDRTGDVASLQSRLRETEDLLNAYDQTMWEVAYRQESLYHLRHERCKTREALDAVEERTAIIRGIVENATDAIVIVSEYGIIESVNAATTRIFGYAEEELLGKNVNMLMPEPESSNHDRYLQRYRDTGQSYLIGKERELMGKRKNGRTFPIALNVSEIRYGSSRRFAGIVKDITARKRTETAIRELNESLEAKVTERTEELRRTQRHLMDQARQSGMAEIAIGLLHNIGNVLNSANVSINLVMESLNQLEVESLEDLTNLFPHDGQDISAFFAGHPQREKVIPFLHAIAQEFRTDQAHLLTEAKVVRTHLEHIQTIISTQQKHATAQGIQETVDLRELITDSLQLANDAFSDFTITVHQDYPECTTLTTERHLVLQILTNIFHNARHALRDSRREDPTLSIIVSRAEPHVISVAITDNGIGIAPDQLNRIFEYGYTTKQGGNGYGLHTAVLAAHELGGNLSATSSGLGHGATLTLTLPLSLSRIPREDSPAPDEIDTPHATA